MNYDEITKLYREIGKKYREWGADKVYLLKSHVNLDGEIQMCLEIAIGGMMIIEDIQKHSKLCWPDIMINILDLNEQPNLIGEIVADAVLL